VVVTGCGTHQPAVKGIVTLNGQPVEGAMVRFHDETALNEPAFVALTMKDGSFYLPAGGNETSGIRPGKYAITVAKYKTGFAMMKSAKDASPESSLYPAIYADPKRTPFRYVVQGNETTVKLQMEGNAK
jgi:hypothetical protein